MISDYCSSPFGPRQKIGKALEGIGGTLAEFFERSAAEEISTGRAADDLVAARLRA